MTKTSVPMGTKRYRNTTNPAGNGIGIQCTALPETESPASSWGSGKKKTGKPLKKPISEVCGNKTGMFRAIQERLYYLYREKKQPFVLAVDEAQYLNYSILMDLKMLMNYSYDSLNCFSLILIGKPYLNHILENQVHEALRQRVTVHYNYEGLSDQEIPDYIYHKLELAGGSRSIMGADALSAVHEYSEGNARKIDNLMTDSLTIGAQQGKAVIDAEVILAAANNQSLT